MATSIILSVLLSIIFTSAMLVLISTIMNCVNYGKYKYSYNLLTSGEYQFNWSRENMYFFSYKELVGKFSSISENSDLSLVFTFDEKGKFRALRLPSTNRNFAFIHAGFIHMDPYSIIYRRKFVKWFEANKETFQERTPAQFEFTEDEIKDLLEIENN